VLAMKREYDLEFNNIEDTSVAAMLLGLPLTGLAALVESYLGIPLEKELQRHDWSRRPIEYDQVRYLINDTRHLFALHDLMLDELRKHDLEDEYRIECRAVAEAEPRERSFDPERFRRIKGQSALSDSQRGALKQLYSWRDQLAQAMQRAPFRIVSDNTLLDLATTPPADTDELAERRGISEWLSREHGQAMLDAIARGRSQPSPVNPPRRRQETPTERMEPRQRDTLGRLKRWREREREERGVGLQAILPTAVLKDLVLNPPASLDDLAAVPRVGKARAARYGDALLRLLNGRRES
jgi:ribonuclease D